MKEIIFLAVLFGVFTIIANILLLGLSFKIYLDLVSLEYFGKD